METFEEKVERYMQCDKKTLAELLAMKELVNENKQQMPYIIDDLRPIGPYYDNQLDPNVVRPTKTAPYGPNTPPYYGDWVVTCSTN